MTRSTVPLVRALALVVVACLATAGCTSAPSPSSVAAPAVVGWTRAEIEQSSDVVSLPSGPPPVFCSPCHPSSSTALAGVATDRGAWLAVGGESVVGAAIWRADRPTGRWRRVPLATQRGATLTGVAIADGRAVAVGASSGAAAAWVSEDAGSSWQPSTVPAVDGASESRVLDVAPTPDGFVAVGYASIATTQRPLFWHSPDGRQWTLAVAPGTGRAQAIAIGGPAGFVAVGSGAQALDAAPAAAWTSSDGVSWKRAPADAALDDGLMQAVIAVRDGYVAVGRSGDGATAAAWTSSDGVTWHRAPTTVPMESRSAYAVHAEMDDLAAVAGSLVAVGWNSDANGAAVVWRSRDGITWTRDADAPSLIGGGMASVASDGSTLVAVGSSGWPDTHAATIWVRPAS
jgi:hypothetical protein